MESINRYAPSVSGSDRGSGSERGSYRHDSSRHDTSRLDSRNLSNSSYPPEYVDAHGHPAQRHPSNMSHPGYGDPRAAGHPRHHPHHHQHHPGYPDPAAAGYPPRHPSHPGYPETQSYSPPRQKDDPSMKANKGFDDFKSFVKRNVEASKADASSPRRRPYTDRLSPGYTEDEITRSRGQGQRPVSGASEEEFKLAQTYIQNPSKYYAQEAAAATNEDEDALGGYEVMPVDDPNHRRHRGRSSAHANDVATNQASRGAAYKYDKGRPLDSSLDSNTPQGQAQGHQQGHGERQPKGAAAAAAPYRYDKGRPLDSSQDSDQSYASDTQVSMATGGAGGAGAQPVIPAAVKEKATLRFNPRDGQWYYYYKGKPISKYDPDKKTGGSQDGPVYKYINGKPVLLPVPTLPLSAPV